MSLVTITRRRAYRSRFATGPGPAWKWLYDVARPDGTFIVYGTDRLAIAERKAREEGWSPVRAWDTSEDRD